MKLFCAPGTLSLLPHIVFLEAGLAFTAIRIDEHTKAIESGGNYRTVNPLGYVPALLLDDGTLLTEGAAIVQYIADQVPSKRLAPPNGTIERAKLQALAQLLFERDAQGLLRTHLPQGIVGGCQGDFSRPAEIALRASRPAPCRSRVFHGKDFTIADANSYSITNWAPRVGFDLSPYPNVRAHHARMGRRPTVQAAMKAEGPIPGPGA
jgi:glutathione S-transferase